MHLHHGKQPRNFKELTNIPVWYNINITLVSKHVYLFDKKKRKKGLVCPQHHWQGCKRH